MSKQMEVDLELANMQDIKNLLVGTTNLPTIKAFIENWRVHNAGVDSEDWSDAHPDVMGYELVIEKEVLYLQRDMLGGVFLRLKVY